jgi:MoaA/NifB/PqqE/SkfB family radical SAM enzyme
VTTNGIRYPDCARDLTGLIDILQFSLEGADRESHDRITVTPSFDRVMESAERALSLGERPTFIHTVTDESIGCVPNIIVLARSMGVLLFLNPCFSYFGNSGLSRENARLLEKMAHGRGVVLDRGFLRFFVDGGNRVTSPRCLAVSSTVVISPDDCLLLPCYHHRTKALPIGSRLLALRQSPEVREARDREGRYPFCEGCAIYCYLRASLFRQLDRYFLPSVLSAGKYMVELYRQGNSKL